MDSARQIIRWAIPGWLLILFLLMFISLNYVISGDYIQFFTMLISNPAITIIGLTGLGIPLGYVIYQVYSWGYWRVLPFRIVTLDRGRKILENIEGLDLYLENTIGQKLIKGNEEYEPQLFPHIPTWLPLSLSSMLSHCQVLRIPKKVPKTEILKFPENYQNNWSLAQFLWFNSLPKNSAVANILAAEASYLFDIFHSIGTARLSLFIAMLFYIIYDTVAYQVERTIGHWEYVISIFINITVTILLIVLFSNARQACLSQGIALMRNNIILSLSQKKHLI